MTHSIQSNPEINGVDTTQIIHIVGQIKKNKSFGLFRFRATNQWITGSRNQSKIQGFYAGGKEDTSRQHALTVDADQPYFLAGDNTAPNPVEHLLHALGSCLTTTLIYHAAVQGEKVEDVEISSEGDLDARGFFGLSDEVNKGYKNIRVHMRVKSDASQQKLTQFAMYSPVFEMVSNAVPVEFKLTTH